MQDKDIILFIVDPRNFVLVDIRTTLFSFPVQSNATTALGMLNSDTTPMSVRELPWEHDGVEYTIRIVCLAIDALSTLASCLLYVPMRLSDIIPRAARGAFDPRSNAAFLHACPRGLVQ